MTQTAPTDTSAQPSSDSTEAAPPEVPISFKLPSLADQVRAQLEKDKADARAKGGSTPARDDSGRFKAADEEEARAAREDGDARRHRNQSKAKGFDDAKAEAIEEREAAGEPVEPPEDASEAVHSSELAEKAKPKGEPKAARWRVKLKAGERRLEQMQAQILEQSRQLAEQARQMEARAKDVDGRAARLAELEALESGLSTDPLSVLYARKIDPEQVTLRHYERKKAGTDGKPSEAQQIPAELKTALEKIAALEARLAQDEAKRSDEAKASQLRAAQDQFLGMVTETDYPDLDVYRDARGDHDVLLSAFGEGGVATELEAKLGRPARPAEILRKLNERAGQWLASREKLAKRFAGRTQPADSGRETEPRTAAKPEGVKPISKTLSNRQASNGSPPAPPDFGSRTDSTKFLVDALARGRTRLDAWRYPHSGRSERAARLPWSLP